MEGKLCLKTGFIGDRWADGGYAHWFGVAWGKIPTGIAYGDDKDILQLVHDTLLVSSYCFQILLQSLYTQLQSSHLYIEDTMTTHVIV